MPKESLRIRYEKKVYIAKVYLELSSIKFLLSANSLSVEVYFSNYWVFINRNHFSKLYRIHVTSESYSESSFLHQGLALRNNPLVDVIDSIQK